MEAARPAFRADTVTSAVIVVMAGHLFHEGFKGLQLTGCHVAHFLSLLSSPYSRHLQEADYSSFWATKKEGLLHTPIWRMKQTLLAFQIFR